MSLSVKATSSDDSKDEVHKGDGSSLASAIALVGCLMSFTRKMFAPVLELTQILQYPSLQPIAEPVS